STGDGEAPPDANVSEPVAALESGYLQAVDAERLIGIESPSKLAIRMERYIGDFIIEGQVLAWLEGSDALDQDVIATVRQAFVLGSERTLEQDVEFGVIEISDIAVKALSPAIND